MGKKVEILSQLELIKSLAHKGDPTAFFTLISPYLRKRYVKARLDGKEYRDTIRMLISEVVEYFSDVQELTTEKFNHWIEENISISEETIASQDEKEFNLENGKRIKTELDAFLNRCHRELMRASLVIKRKKIRERKKFPQVLYYNKTLRIILLSFSSIILVSSLFFVMYMQRVCIRISFVKEREVFSFSIPPLTLNLQKGEETQSDSFKNVTALKDSIGNTHSDTVKSVKKIENKREIVKKNSALVPIVGKQPVLSSNPSPSATSSSPRTNQISQQQTSTSTQSGISPKSEIVKTSKTLEAGVDTSTTTPSSIQQTTPLQSAVPAEQNLQSQPGLPDVN